MSWTDRSTEIEAAAEKHAGCKCIVTTKNNWFWRTLGTILGDWFVEDFATTLGPLIALPSGWSFDTARRVIVHEATHTRHCRWFGLFVSPWLGLFVVALLQWLLPVGFNWFRYRMELHADTCMWRWLKATGWSNSGIRDRADRFARTVSSWKYLKPIPTRWALWGFRRKAEQVIGSDFWAKEETP